MRWFTIVGLYADSDTGESWVEWAKGATVKQAIENACALAECREPSYVIAVFAGRHEDLSQRDED